MSHNNLKVTAILNSHKCKNKKPLIKKLNKKFPDIEILETSKAGDATKFAKKSNSNIIIAIGGDGTVNEVVNGIIGKDVMLGIIPKGTANLIARAYGIPKNTNKALDIIDFKRRKKIDIGNINGRNFIIAAGIGIDAEMYKNVEPELKKMFGEVAYSVSMVKTMLNYKPDELIVKINNKKYKGYYVLFCNMGKFSKVFQILPEAKEDDGLLDILIFTKKDIAAQFRYLYGILAQQRKQFKDILHFKAEKIEVTAKEPALIHADAELIGKTPAKVKIIKSAIEIIC